MSPKKIKKLADKKYRTETGLFLVEGEKNIRELLDSDFYIEEILGTKRFLDAIDAKVTAYEQKKISRPITLEQTDEETLVRAGTLMTNDAGIAIVRQKATLDTKEILERGQEDLVLALDDVRDPGNLGTIIRIADWFGVSHIVASPTTTDVYNPKTISATMGSFTRVSVTYCDLLDLLKQAQTAHIPIVAAVMNGKDLHEDGLPHHGILLMGSESHGVSDATLKLATLRVTIPRFGGAESLNVGVATGILLDALRRR